MMDPVTGAARSSPDLAPILRDLEILGPPREGGMGAVYLARHKLLGELRVVKLIHPRLASQEEVRERFLREARLAARFRQPCFAQVFDFSAEGDLLYLVMEYVDGVTLRDLIAVDGAASPAVAVHLTLQLLGALASLHREGVIHRDISTDNVMLTQDHDGLPRIKLIDLGVARRIGAEASLTRLGEFVGKVRYAAPEQFSLPSSEIDARCDLYASGILLYELLTGCFPIRGTDMKSVVTGHLLEPPLSFAESDPRGRVPEELREVVLSTLAKRREARPGSAQDLALRLRATLPSHESHGLEGSRLSDLLEKVRGRSRSAGLWLAPSEPVVASEPPDASRGGGEDPTFLLGTAARVVSLPAVAAPVGAEERGTPGVACVREEESTVAQPTPGILSVAPVAPVGPRTERSLAPTRWWPAGIGLLAVGVLVGIGLTLARNPRVPISVGGPSTGERTTSRRAAEATAQVEPAARGTQTGLTGPPVSEPSGRELDLGSSQPAAGIEHRGPDSSLLRSAARRLTGTAPEYPQEAISLGVSGQVRLAIEVLADGTVGDVRVLEQPHPSLGEAAARAARSWRFQAASEGGRSVASSYQAELNFALPAGEEPVFDPGPDITPPRRRRSVEPVYPAAASEAGVEGRLLAELVVSSTGKVSSVRVLEGLSPEIDRAARTALLQWEFEPALREGRKVAVRYRVGLDFRLSP